MLAERPEMAAAVGSLVDRWLVDLGRALTADIVARPQIDASVQPGERIALENRAEAGTQRGVAWLEVLSGNFPLPAGTWIGAANLEGVETVLDVLAAESVIGDPGFWRALDTFHQALCQCEFINKRLATVDELNRLRTKAEYADAARADAHGELVRVLGGDRARAAGVAIDRRADPLLAACSLIGDSLRIAIRAHPEADQAAGFEKRVALVAKASRLRIRQVALRDDWFRRDHGPLLGRFGPSEAPVALLPTSPRSYEMVDPASGERQRVNAAVAARLAPFATSFYRRFKQGPVSILDLVRFGMPGLRKDLFVLAAMGIALGLLGTVTPMMTGMLFDAAIPQADRFLVLQIVAALLLVALMSSAFSLTQGVASLRIQSRMDYGIQAALWDRMLDLPSRFFRAFSAGDLAERAGGINTIRRLVAGAGVGAVLGFLSSQFDQVLWC
jgi:ATP-binding cassette subfamily C protein